MQKDQYQPIDIRALASKDFPKLAKWIPNGIYSFLERLLHIDHLNEFFSTHCNSDAQTFLDEVVKELDLTIQWHEDDFKKIEALKGQRVIVAANHPYGGAESMALFSVLHRLFPQMKLVVQNYLKFIKPIRTACVFNKGGARTLMNAVISGASLLFYPAGYCSRLLSTGEVYDYKWRDSFVRIARKHKLPIVVIYIDGQLSKKVHRWTRFRQIFGIKTSIETIFLVDEMFKLYGSTLKMVVGDVITPDLLDENLSDQQHADKLRQYCYDLRANPSLGYDPAKEATLPQM
ncbi:MAG: hypothetical protein ACOX0W_01045 [Sphaerochaetaceae bacterium]|jgi:putative hemolysin